MYMYDGPPSMQDEAPEVVILGPTKTFTARRSHICDCRLKGCFGEIRPGQRYRRTVLLEEGVFNIFKEGLECGGHYG